MAVIVPYWPLPFEGNADCDLRTRTGASTIVTNNNIQVQLFKPYVNLPSIQQAETGGSPATGGGLTLSFILRGILKTDHPVSSSYEFFSKPTADYATRLTLASGRRYIVTDSIKHQDLADDGTLYHFLAVLDQFNQ